MKRVGLCFLEAEKGKADKYIDYFLTNINQHLSRLDVVISGEISEESLSRLRKLLPQTQFFFADKNSIENEKVYSELETHITGMDELIYFNSSLFGPFYDLSGVFSTMTNREADFYGITGIRRKNGETSMVFADSCFLGLKKQVFLSETFKGHLIDFLLTHNKTEVDISEALIEHGFTQDIYAIDETLCRDTFDPMQTNARYLIEQKKCPILKKGIFYSEYIEALECRMLLKCLSI